MGNAVYNLGRSVILLIKYNLYESYIGEIYERLKDGCRRSYGCKSNSDSHRSQFFLGIPAHHSQNTQGIQNVGFRVMPTDIDQESSDKIINLYDRIIAEVKKKQDNGTRVGEDQLFLMGRELGSMLFDYEFRNKKKYPHMVVPPIMLEFEERLKNSPNVSDTVKEELFEQYYKLWLESGETIPDAKSAVKGLYCGTHPDLCPPTN